MLSPKANSKQLLRAFFSVYSMGRKDVPIMAGPLKGRRLPKPAAMQNLAMLLGRYEPYVVLEVLTLEQAKVAYDIGAHIGFMALVMAELVGPTGRVFAFEPIPENCTSIEELIKLNKLQAVVQVVPFALSDSNGIQRMMIRESSSMHLLESTFEGANGSSYPTLAVKTCTLDSFIFEQGDLPPDLMKVDVEGAESLVLQGARQTIQVFSPVMLVEIHGPRNAGKTWDLLEGMGYSWGRLAHKRKVSILTKQNLLSYFSRYSWTHQFLLRKDD